MADPMSIRPASQRPSGIIARLLGGAAATELDEARAARGATTRRLEALCDAGDCPAALESEPPRPE